MPDASALIHDAMTATGLSSRSLARVLAVDERTMRRWNAGDREIPGPAVQLLRVLTASPGWAKRLTPPPPDARP